MDYTGIMALQKNYPSFAPRGCILPFDSPTDCNNCWVIKTFVQFQNMRQSIPLFIEIKR